MADQDAISDSGRSKGGLFGLFIVLGTFAVPAAYASDAGL